MKKYLVVAWDTYYPGDGLDNIVADYSTVEECLEYIYKNLKSDSKLYGPWMCDYIEIIDQDTMREVWNQTMYNPEKEEDANT